MIKQKLARMLSSKYDIFYLTDQSKELLSPVMENSHLSTVPLNCRNYLNATFLPPKNYCYGGILNEEREFIHSSAWIKGLEDKYSFKINDVKRCSDEVLFIGIMHSVWGHSFTDNIKKCWWLFTDEFIRQRKRGIQVKYMTLGNQPLQNFCFDIFELMGYDLHDAERIIDLTQYKTVWIPDNAILARDSKIQYTTEYCQLIERIKNNIPQQSPIDNDKIYFTRSHLPKLSRNYGEKAIEHWFKKKGYSIIAPEELFVKDQLAIVSHCSHFATTEGSVSHSSLFCNDHCNVEILRKANYINPYSIGINEMSAFKSTFIDAHHSTYVNKKCPYCGPFYLYPTKQLKRFLHTKRILLPYSLRPSYWYYCFRYTIWKAISPIIFAIRCRMNPKLKITHFTN